MAKYIPDFILIAAALSSVFFLAGLSDVPRRIRYSVAAIGPSILLTALLHMANTKHLDWGLGAMAVAVGFSGFFGYHHLNTAKLTRETRRQLWKRFGIILGISCVAVGIVGALILKVHEKKPAPVPAGTKTVPNTADTVTAGDTTEKSIQDFMNYGSVYNQ